jgi:hypothetical protein
MDAKSTEITFDVHLQPGEPLTLPKDAAAIHGPGNWQITIRPTPVSPTQLVRDHSAFLNSFAPEDEGLYDDYSAG